VHVLLGEIEEAVGARRDLPRLREGRGDGELGDVLPEELEAADLVAEPLGEPDVPSAPVAMP
jgi:hypothetical protein